MNISSIDLGQFAFAATVLIGVVNGFKLAINKNWPSFFLFVLSLVAGVVFGTLHWFGLPSAEVGFALGVASSGTYELAQRIGGQ